MAFDTQGEPSDTTQTVTQGTVPAQADMPLLLGRYRVVEKCGQGGFGRVLVCWDTRLQRRVAIKVIPLSLSGSEEAEASSLREALQEARTSSLLAHPNIVAVHDFESAGRYAYLVMEYIDGLNLLELLKRVEGGCLTYEECAHLLTCVGSALQYAHENGVLHLDIKPSNIMIDRSGIAKLTDFGMSTLASAVGYGGARGGTIGYMPPEQINGQLVDERTDIFSLGVVLWTALCGVNPFEADTAEESLAKILQGPAVSLAQENLTLNQDIELVLEKCLAINPQDRYSSVESLMNHLIPLLGIPGAGQKSLQNLVLQAQDDEPTEEEWSEVYREKTPAAKRFPWLEPLILKSTSALVTGLCIFSIAPVLFASKASIAAAVIITSALAALWPPSGFLSFLLSLLAALGIAHFNQATLLTLVAVGALGITWWIACGSTTKASSIAALFSCVAHIPSVSANLCGFVFRPLTAFVSSAFAWVLSQFFSLSLQTGFNAPAVVDALIAQLSSRAQLLSLVGCSLAGLAASLIGRDRSGWRTNIAQLSCAGIIIFFQVLAHGVENSGIWSAQEIVGLVFEIFLSIVMCLVAALKGPVTVESEG